MRILQIIDSLETGGAERISVNYANALVDRVAFSGLVATRSEGGLRHQLDERVRYLFLKKNRALDVSALRRLRRYCTIHNIEYIHAHSTSFFTAVLIKLTKPGIKVIWHDHYGMSESLADRKYFPLNVMSLFFSGIITVNFQLKEWAERKLYCRNITYLPNFTFVSENLPPQTDLKGSDGKRILMLANLRRQKDHFMLIEVARHMKVSHPDWTFHLVGKDFLDSYSAQVKSEIEAAGLNETVFLYGSRKDTDAIIRTCDIAILTSASEGLPVALLEYGLHRRPVVVTSVGQIPSIVSDAQNGYLVPSGDDALFLERLKTLADSPEMRQRFGEALHETTNKENSAQSVLSNYLSWISRL